MQLDANDYILHFPVVEDLDALVAYYQTNAAFFESVLPVLDMDYKTRNGVAGQLRRDIMDSQMGNQMVFYVKTKIDNYLVARIAYTDFKRACFQSCQLGITVTESFAGKGVMSSCLPVANKFVFEHLNMHRIESIMSVNNIASRHLVEKVGFCFEGIQKSCFLLNGKWQDCYRYALINNQ